MNNPRVLKWMVRILLAGSVTSWWYVFQTRSENLMWAAEVSHLSEGLAVREAQNDYRVGRLRLLRLEGENAMLRFSGEHEGPFEIWIPQYFPSISKASQSAKKRYVDGYNMQMRFMHQQFKRSKPKPTDAATNSAKSKESL